MGRYSFAAQNVHKTASQLLHANRIPAPPPWYPIVASTPPSTRLTRPPLQRPNNPNKASKKSSRLFKPLSLKYTEDQLRWEYYNDHPWELARPRVVLEDDGKDREVYDWSVPLDYTLRRPLAGQRDEFGRGPVEWEEVMETQGSRPINGEAVIQRWQYLLTHTALSNAAAYDMARKELYRFRHQKEVETRVAREESQAVGGYFGLGPLEVGEILEDKAYENWKEWAVKETQALRALQGSAYTGNEEGSELEVGEPATEGALEEVSGSIPGSKSGQTARGGAAVRP
ncbi:Putative mitochondrial ribosomal protein S25 [Septoria linicola]|uniref:Small ribosomal subunit protein mS23 n=1 Tax=Septoria linicola TaxID=215465 RepID=A0A9Q9B781_9PEZI|nr:putative mitochondrial ribosomal protein S25 [Septoria linicola]USW58693.1 Putative mitochondrial ribosomal protein S25 [Septoria linicola]